MKVFLSWSGSRSKRVAEELKTWLPDVLQALDPWVSSQDILKGTRGSREIANELEGVNFGIICLTAESQHSQWVNFEAGALSKQISEARVVPLLIDLKPSDLTGPLAQFQATSSENSEDMLKLVLDLNGALKESAISTERLTRTFHRNWPDLDRKLIEIRSEINQDSESQKGRTQENMIEEILLLMRQQERRLVDIEGRMQYTIFDGIESQEVSPADIRRRPVGFVENIVRNFSKAGVRVSSVKPAQDGIWISVKNHDEASASLLEDLAEKVYGSNKSNRFVHILDSDGNTLVSYPF